MISTQQEEEVGTCGQISESMFLSLVECLKSHGGKVTLLPSLAVAPSGGYAAHSYRMMMAPTKKCSRLNPFKQNIVPATSKSLLN